MDIYGNEFKYKIDRVPSNAEQNNQLPQQSALDVTPSSDLTIIELNSNYMDIVDRNFTWKGANTLISTVIISGSIYNIIMTSLLPANTDANFVIGLAFFIFISIIGWASHAIYKEAFFYTHYPIRLDKKNSMVHVFRQNGSVLSTPWRSIFFCLGTGFGKKQEIHGHILHEGDITIQETFTLPVQIDKKDNKVALLQHWEFIRRYMEDGPASIIEHTDFYLPIAYQHENFHAYWQYRNYPLRDYSKLLQFAIFSPFFITYPFRWFAMKTSKIPVWPQYIQQQCPVDPDDPYIRNASTNQI